MAILKPYAVFEVSCPGCNGTCQVIIWNGVERWEFAPQPELTFQEDCAIATIKCSGEMAERFIEFAHEDAPHVLDRVILWAKDTKTYDVLLALSQNPSAVHDANPSVRH